MSLEYDHHCIILLNPHSSLINRKIFEIFNNKYIISTSQSENAHLNHHSGRTSTEWLEIRDHHGSLEQMRKLSSDMMESPRSYTTGHFTPNCILKPASILPLINAVHQIQGI